MTDNDGRIEVGTEDLRVLFDAVCNSLDFGSGFLDTPEVEALRRVAVILGVDPDRATPHEFTSRYPHRFNGSYNGPCLAGNHTPSRCGQPYIALIHRQPGD